MQVAKFKTNKSFNIVGIGLVLTGEIIEGEISPGYILKITFHGADNIYKIDAVEAVDYISKGESETGLILDPVDKNLQADLNIITGQTIPVFDKL